MSNPWNLRASSIRLANSTTNFIIFCEDEFVEPEYLNSFSTMNLRVSPVRNFGQHHRQVDWATEYFRENNMIEFLDGQERLKVDEGTYVWCVFDRDKENNDGADTAFNDSIAAASARGMHVAWSNDNFELWILLHFTDVDPGNQEYHYRKKYYEDLTQYFRTILPRNDDEQKLFSRDDFDYYQMMKTRRRFITITLQHMKDKTPEAIARAKALHQAVAIPPRPPHLQMPCTLVYKLVEKLLGHQ
jgi:hypothetical protein